MDEKGWSGEEDFLQAAGLSLGERFIGSGFLCRAVLFWPIPVLTTWYAICMRCISETQTVSVRPEPLSLIQLRS